MKTQTVMAVMLVAAGTGCTTVYDGGMDTVAAREDLERQNLTMQVQRLQERVDGMDAERQDLYQRMERMESEVKGLRNENAERAAATEHTLATLEANRQRERDEIVDTLSRKMANVIRPAAGAGGGGTRSASGYEHVVQPNETLSAIAAAYKVKPSVIIEANNLKNSNNLRVGQKLFIPE